MDRRLGSVFYIALRLRPHRPAPRYRLQPLLRHSRTRPDAHRHPPVRRIARTSPPAGFLLLRIRLVSEQPISCLPALRQSGLPRAHERRIVSDWILQEGDNPRQLFLGRRRKLRSPARNTRPLRTSLYRPRRYRTGIARAPAHTAPEDREHLPVRTPPGKRHDHRFYPIPFPRRRTQHPQRPHPPQQMELAIHPEALAAPDPAIQRPACRNPRRGLPLHLLSDLKTVQRRLPDHLPGPPGHGDL